MSTIHWPARKTPISSTPSPLKSPTTGMSPAWPNVDRRVDFGEPAVAVEVEIPLAVAEHADLPDAVAVPVAGHRHVARRAVVEHVVDQVGPALARARCASAARAPLVASSSVGGMFFILPSGRVGKLSASGRPGSRAIAHGSRGQAGP